MHFVHAHDADAVQYVDELLAVDKHTFLEFARHDLVEVRIFLVDKLRIELDCAEREANLRTLDFDGHVAFQGWRAQDFLDALVGQHTLGFGLDRELHFVFHHRKAPSVRRNGRQFLVFEAQKKAHEHPAGVVLRHGVGGFAEDFLQRQERQGEAERLVCLWKRGEIPRREAVYRVFRRAGRDVDAVVFVRRDFNQPFYRLGD